MAWQVIFSARSRTDLQKIVKYIARYNSAAAERFGSLLNRENLLRVGFDAGAARKHAFTMSAQEIIAELPKLKPEELRLVKAKVDDLARTKRKTIGEALLEVAGTAEGLPRDMARNHDHYLHGTPRQES